MNLYVINEYISHKYISKTLEKDIRKLDKCYKVKEIQNILWRGNVKWSEREAQAIGIMKIIK